LAGNGGYIIQLFYRIEAKPFNPSEGAVSFVSEAHDRNLIPILRLLRIYP
jgi:hypothetical protein